MNKNTIRSLAIVALMAAGAASAQAQVQSAEAGFEPTNATQHSALTRQQVTNDYLKARAQAPLGLTSGDAYLATPVFKNTSASSSLTRAQVRAETVQALQEQSKHFGSAWYMME